LLSIYQRTVFLTALSNDTVELNPFLADLF